MANYLSQSRVEGPIWLDKDDESFLRTQVSAAEAQIEILEYQINSKAAPEPCFELERRRDDAVIQLNKAQNILSPIRRLPSELLSEIMLHSCWPEDGIFTDQYKIIRYALMLSNVCVAFRATAHDTAELWSTLCLSADVELPQDTSFVKKWLSRSRGRPLDLHLYFPSYSKTVPSISMEIMHIIAEFHPRIRVFRFKGNRTVLYPLISLQSASLPLLETVSLNLEARSLYYATVTALQAHQWMETQPSPIQRLSVPKLRQFEISGCEISEIFIAALLIPFEQLTSVKIDPSGVCPDFQKPGLCFGLLQRCNNVVALEIHVPLGPEVHPHSSVHLPALKSFTLRNDTENIVPIRCITAPVLEELTLAWPRAWYRKNGRDICEDVVSFQQRSSFTLSSLTIRNIDMMDEHVIDMLSFFPSVKLFRMDRIQHKASLLKRLTCSDNQPIVFPQLTQLEIAGFYMNPNLECDLLRKMIISRLWSNEAPRDGLARLQKVIFDHQSKMPKEEDMSYICGLSGLEVVGV